MINKIGAWLRRAKRLWNGLPDEVVIVVYERSGEDVMTVRTRYIPLGDVYSFTVYLTKEFIADNKAMDAAMADFVVKHIKQAYKRLEGKDADA